MKIRFMYLLYIAVIAGMVISAFIGNKAVSVLSESTIKKETPCVIVDAGHGGVDGGATSCTGVLESAINLEIAIKVNDLLNFLGVRTKMIRATDCSVYTSGKTIAAKKVSDLKERVRIVDSIPNGLLISIHQNYFQQSQYSGAQVFYNAGQGSMALAQEMQGRFKITLNPNSKRQAKRASGVYLMEHIQNPGILVECGFLSNPQEESLLQNKVYQQNLACVITTSVSRHLFSA